MDLLIIGISAAGLIASVAAAITLWIHDRQRKLYW